MQASSPYTGAWWTYIVTCCFAWLSSAVFHSRDTKLTERTDYIAAIAVVFAGAALAAVRVSGTTKCACLPFVSATPPMSHQSQNVIFGMTSRASQI